MKINEIDFLKAMVKDLENHIKVIKRRIKKMEEEKTEKTRIAKVNK